MIRIFIYFTLLGQFIGCNYTSNPVENNYYQTADSSQSDETSGPQTPSKLPTQATDQLYFNTDIYPILEKNCTSCHIHGLGTPKDWSNYGLVTKNIDTILGSIKHQPGFMPMPFGRSKLEQSKVEMIEEWANSGMLEIRPIVTGPDPTPGPTPTPEPEPTPAPTPDEPETPGPTIPSDEEQIAHGKGLFQKNCTGCHNNREMYPKLTGQPEGYIYGQLKYFRLPEGEPRRRDFPIMNLYATRILKEEKDLKAVAKYLAAQNPCEIPDVVVDLKLSEYEPKPDPINGEKLFNQQCAYCHLPDNPMDYPAMYGQNTKYLLNTLLEYQSGKRPSILMKGMVGGLTRAQLVDISVYLNGASECN